MAFAPSRNPRQGRQQVAADRPKTEVVLPTLNSTKLCWLHNRLSGLDKESWLRFLPTFDEQGNEREFLLAGSDPSSSTGILGDAFWSSEMTQLYKNGVRKTVVTKIHPMDKRGTPIRLPKKDFSPAYLIISRFNFACFIHDMITAKGYDGFVPDAWLKMHKAGVTCDSKPDTVFMVQALALTLDGITKTDAQGQAIPTPGVFVLKASALKTMLQMVSARKSNSRPISQQDNMLPTADIVSCDKGFSVKYCMTLAKGKDGKDRPDYALTLNEQMPLPADYVKSVVEPWEQLLPDVFIEDSIAEMIQFLGPEVVDYGLRNTPYEDYLPAEIAGSSNDIKDCPYNYDEARALQPKAHTSAPAQATAQAPAPVTTRVTGIAIPGAGSVQVPAQAPVQAPQQETAAEPVQAPAQVPAQAPAQPAVAVPPGASRFAGAMAAPRTFVQTQAPAPTPERPQGNMNMANNLAAKFDPSKLAGLK